MLLVAGGVAIGLGLAAFIVFGRGLFGSSGQAGPPPQVPMPAASTPNLKVLDEQATCVLAVPAAQEGLNAVREVIADPNKADWAKVQKAHDNLKLIADMADPTMRDDINQQAALLSQLLSLSRTGGKMSFDMDDYKAAGLRLSARCMRYAS